MSSTSLFARKLESFFVPSETDRWQSVLRIGLGFQIVFYTLSSRSDWNELFSSAGQALINRHLTERVLNLQSPLVPRLGWLISLGQLIGLNESIVLWTIWTILVISGVFLICGLFCRTAAITAWFVHLAAAKSEHLLSYGMDNFTTIGLFYLMLSPLPDRLALDALIWETRARDPQMIGFLRRVLQLHVCFVYFFGGLTKAIGPEWSNGTSLWRVLTSPPYNLVAPEILVGWKHFLPPLGIAVWFVEITYPSFIWWKKTRLAWLLTACAMHVVIGLTMGLYLFSFIMLILNLAAFGPGFAFSDNLPSVRFWPIKSSKASPP